MRWLSLFLFLIPSFSFADRANFVLRGSIEPRANIYVQRSAQLDGYEIFNISTSWNIADASIKVEIDLGDQDLNLNEEETKDTLTAGEYMRMIQLKLRDQVRKKPIIISITSL